jgi:hypothetical protein
VAELPALAETSLQLVTLGHQPSLHISLSSQRSKTILETCRRLPPMMILMMIYRFKKSRFSFDRMQYLYPCPFESQGLI